MISLVQARHVVVADNLSVTEFGHYHLMICCLQSCS